MKNVPWIWVLITALVTYFLSGHVGKMVGKAAS